MGHALLALFKQFISFLYLQLTLITLIAICEKLKKISLPSKRAALFEKKWVSLQPIMNKEEGRRKKRLTISS